MSLWGQITDAAQVEDAVEQMIRKWIDSTLTELERQRGLDLRGIARPRSYRLDTDVRKMPEDQLPAVIVVSAGMPEEPDQAEDGRVDAILLIGLAAIVKGPDRHATSKLARRYATALGTLVDKFGGELAPIAHVLTRPIQRFDEIENRADRSLAAGYVTFAVLVPGMWNRYGRPDEPDDPETDPPGTSPEDAAHLTTNVTVDEE